MKCGLCPCAAARAICAITLLTSGCYTTSLVRAVDIVPFAAGEPVPAFGEKGPKRTLLVDGSERAVLVDLDDASTVEPVLKPVGGEPRAERDGGISRVEAPLEISLSSAETEGPRRVLLSGRNGELAVELAALSGLRVEEYSPGKTAALVVPLALLGTAAIAGGIAFGVSLSGLGRIR